jgi:outer membrane protein OmpA-like peptidoglycan-associated protein
MRNNRMTVLLTLLMGACGGAPANPDAPASGAGQEPAQGDGQPDSDSQEFQIKHSTTAADAHGATESKIKPTKTEAAVKFFVVDKVKNEPIPGIVISLQSPDGKKYYTEETDSAGYGEVLVPIAQTYEIVYLSLGRKDITAKVAVPNEPRQNIKLTLRYKRREPEPVAATPEKAPEPPAFRLDGVTFASGSAKLLPESFPRLDSVVEYMTHKKSTRIEISGHTDNVGSAKTNQKLSQERADACREYLLKQGIDGGRIEAVGYGADRPVADNDTEEGRQQNRRIEAKEL